MASNSTTPAATGRVPVVVTSNVTLNAGAAIPASSLFRSISNPYGASVVQYGFWDTSSDGGYFTVDGVRQSYGAWISVTANNIGSVQYVGGSKAATKVIYVDVYDGKNWSVNTTVVATTIISPPTIAVHNITLNSNSSIGAASLITSAQYKNGVGLTQYGFWDSGEGGGFFTVNGIRQSSGAWISVTANNLGVVKYVAGSGAGSETLYVTVYDGQCWSANAALIAATITATTVNSGQTSDGYHVTSGSETVLFGGIAVRNVAGAGGNLYDFGNTRSTTVSSGGAEYISSGGSASSTTVSCGGNQYVLPAGKTSGTTVRGGGAEYISSGGTASSTTVTGSASNRGILTVSSGGVAAGTVVSGGGNVQVYSGGVASGTIVSNGGTSFAFQGGALTGTRVLSGGCQYVSAGGTASGTTVSAGGQEFVCAGGVEQFSVIGSGGLEFVSSGGTVNGGTVISGGKITVASGGNVLGGLTISGGTALISGSAAGGHALTFAGPNGTLALYNLPGFAQIISAFGLGDEFDLGGFIYSNNETRSFVEAADKTSGTLTVIGGNKQAKLTLLGGYVTSNFALSTDGVGGTFVKFAP